jgi:hypothetical protein
VKGGLNGTDHESDYFLQLYLIDSIDSKHEKVAKTAWQNNRKEPCINTNWIFLFFFHNSFASLTKNPSTRSHNSWHCFLVDILWHWVSMDSLVIQKI